MVNLPIVTWFLAASIGVAFGVQCYVGSSTSIRLIDCGESSDKCVTMRVNEIVTNVCYSHVTWSQIQEFNPRVGCQKSVIGGLIADICICVGDKCNGVDFEPKLTTPSVESPETTTTLPSDATTEDSTEGRADYIETTTRDMLGVDEYYDTDLQTTEAPANTSIEAASGVYCYVGSGSSKHPLNCGTSSEKCVTIRVDYIETRGCYDQINWESFPTFNPAVGCQKYNAFEVNAEICICKGDKCNDDSVEEVKIPATTSEETGMTKFEGETTDDTPPMTTAANAVVDVHRTMTEVINLQQENIEPTTATVKSSKGVYCYVGAGSTKILMDCGTSSNKCAKSIVNDIVSRFCYSQMSWGSYPTFHPRVGCQSFSESGFNSKICICVGDKCNDGGFEEDYPSTTSQKVTETTKLTEKIIPAEGALETTTSNSTSLTSQNTSSRTTVRSGKFDVKVDDPDTSPTVETKSVISTTSGANSMCANAVLIILVTLINRFL